MPAFVILKNLKSKKADSLSELIHIVRERFPDAYQHRAIGTGHFYVKHDGHTRIVAEFNMTQKGAFIFYRLVSKIEEAPFDN